jgi:hypothetical protein
LTRGRVEGRNRDREGREEATSGQEELDALRSGVEKDLISATNSRTYKKVRRKKGGRREDMEEEHAFIVLSE